ncbi:hypothetical protein PVAP13_1KG188208 [Panicum virgatum]|uniref:Uncharacterized protein n=1 Tax=Panicum virgatum TaxID=38727 RepID=A0A8T0XDJ0_PANVG|nr:hypothetical protein PVAP13_1KG188208 [Panicum virgatum]
MHWRGAPATQHMVCSSCFGVNDWIPGWYTCRCVLFGAHPSAYTLHAAYALCCCASHLVGILSGCAPPHARPFPCRLFIHPEQSSPSASLLNPPMSQLGQSS